MGTDAGAGGAGCPHAAGVERAPRLPPRRPPVLVVPAPVPDRALLAAALRLPSAALLGPSRGRSTRARAVLPSAPDAARGAGARAGVRARRPEAPAVHPVG